LLLLLGFAFVDSSWKKREREREQSFLLCEFLPLYDNQKKKVQLNQRIFLGKKWDKVALPKILQDSLRKFFNSHLFWLNSHRFFASWSRNAADLQALRTKQARPGCEFNQKRCELKIFLL